MPKVLLVLQSLTLVAAAILTALPGCIGSAAAQAAEPDPAIALIEHSRLDLALEQLRQPLPLPAAPYRIPRPRCFVLDLDVPTNSTYYRTAYSAQTAIDGARYAAFTDRGMSWLQVMLGLDLDRDGAFESVYPTGLQYEWEWTGFPGFLTDAGFNLSPGLQLELALPSLRIGCYNRENEQGVLQYAWHDLQLEDLTRDSDGDGLSDVTEGYFFTDPQLTDSDADGLDDLRDPMPNVNLADVGELELGIARGLISRRISTYELDYYRLPLALEYIFCSGLGPVPYSAEGRRTVCLWSAEQFERADTMHITGMRVGLGWTERSPQEGTAPPNDRIQVWYHGGGCVTYGFELEHCVDGYYPLPEEASR